MSKLMLLIGLAGALMVANPIPILDHLGPEAQFVGSKLRNAIDVGGYFRLSRGAFDSR